jgi:hypothetical protein
MRRGSEDERQQRDEHETISAACVQHTVSSWIDEISDIL